MESEVKKCIKCGSTLTLDHFRRTPLSADGYAKTCKQCRQSKKEAERNSELAGYQARQLIEELRARGYVGTLSITKEIKV